MQIDGMGAIITGAASGMGAKTAVYLAEQGARLILLDKDADALQALAKQLDAQAIACDVSDAGLLEQALGDLKDIRIAVNCAGIATGQRIVGREGPMPLDDFKHVIDVNLLGTFNTMRLVAHHMSLLAPLKNEEQGVIINTASVAAFEGQVGQVAYSASKGGIVAMTLPAARELARFGIRVCAIAPGLMDTPMMSNMSDEVQESLKEQLLFPKCFGAPRAYATLVGHIVENEMLNGEVIRLDGGLRMQ